MGEEGAGAGFHLRANIIVFVLAALEWSGQILLHLDRLEAGTMRRADLEDDPVGEPEQKNGDGEELGEPPEPVQRLVDEGVRSRRTPSWGLLGHFSARLRRDRPILSWKDYREAYTL